ncbi:MAG TPA: hypothetical protein VF366_05865 [Dehalococcoidia bacterium]
MKKLVLLLALALMILSTGCDLSGLNLPITPQSAAINSFGASPATISAGGSSTLGWTVTGASTVNIDQGIGNVALSGSRVVMPGSTTVYTLTATNSSGVSVTATAQVIVSGGTTPTPPPIPPPTPTGYPVINYFTANPSSVYAGDQAVLNWNVSNATSIAIDNSIGTVSASGNTWIFPTVTTTYTLTATNSYGWATKSVTVFVSGTPTPAFSVISATASVNPPFVNAECPTNIYSEAVITVNGAGTVSYRWEDSEGGIKPTENIYFSSAGSQSVGTWWPIGLSGTFWIRLHVLSPNDTSSNQASFTLNCVAAQATGWAGTWDTSWGTMVLTQTGDSVSGTYTWDSGHIEGSVTGNVFSGLWSEAPSYNLPDDAGTVVLTLSPDSNSITGNWRYGLSGDWDGSWTGTRISP